MERIGSHLYYNNVKQAYYCQDRFNFFDSSFINHGAVIKKIKITKKSFYKLASTLKLVIETKDVNTSSFVYKPGAYGKVAKFIKFIDSYLLERLTKYDKIYRC